MPAMRAALSLSLALLSLLAFGQSDITEARRPSVVRVSEAYGKLPITFEANQGQTDARARFISRGPGYSLFLTGDRIVFALRNNGNGDPHEEDGSSRDSVLQMKLVRSSREPHLEGTDLLPSRSNYFIGRDPKKWQTSVREYTRVRYESVYPGVDLVFYGSQGKLEYDLVVAPRTDPHIIRFDVDGAESIHRDENGDLLLQVSGKTVRWCKPVVYQEKDGVRHEISGRYVVRRKNRVSFELGSYDSARPLVIDPVLLYSTYLGGSGYDRGNGIAVDSAGNSYITGYTASSNFPTANPLQPACAGSCGDAFIVKLDSSGALVYSTFLGGTLGSGAYAIAVDSAGQAYVTGWTEATDFPTLNPLQPSCGGSCVNEDGFVSVLNSTGSALVYSTYLGGSGTDYVAGIAVDSLGNAYVTGSTNSTDFPIVAALESTCVNCASPTLYSHAFVTEISPSGSPAVFSTFLGGSGDDHGNSIAVDGAGNSYITGWTSSTDFPTASPFQSACSTCAPGSSYTAFVSKVAASGTSLAYSTYLGGSAGDQGNSIAVDSSGSAYVTGDTFSTDFPTVNPLESKPTGGVTGEDAFVTKLSETGSSLIYSTYLGGIEPDLGQSIAVDVAGNAYVAGWTQSTDFPTSNPIQSTYGGGDYDAFVSVINSSGSAYVYSTYFGGSESDQGRSIAVDTLGNAYLTGSTTSTNFQNVNATQASNGGNGDAFVTKILPSVSATTVTLASSLNPAAENQAVTLIAMVAGQQGGTPTGTVTFENGAVTMGTVTLSDGFASFNQSFAIGGTEPIVAVYSGDATFAASSSPVLYEGVGGYPSITSLTATPTPSAIGQSVIITAMVSSTYGSPTGTVTLMNGSTSIGTASLVSGLATFTETFSSPGAQSITAVYSGDVSFAGSVSSALQQTVMANFTLTLTGSGAGSVSSLDGKINGCTIAGGANCSTTYTSGSLVTLVPTPTNGSSFYWSTGVTGVPCSGSGACTLAITNNTTVSGVFTSTGFSAIQASPTFSIDYNDTASQFPVGIRHGQGRFWDTPGVEWAFVQTSACTMSPCPDSFSWTSVDTLLGTMAQNSVYTAQYALARTPTFLSSNPSDTTCHGGPGECDAPIDLNFDGTGADLIWRNWVAAISAHVNASGYADTHAHVKYWEIWNEPDTLAFWGGSAPATQGTFDQLVRMEEDAYCIIKGGSFINDYTGESCTAVLATVTSVALTVPTDPTAVVVMPSYHGGSTSLALAACFLYGTGASGGLCQNRSLHYGGAGAAHTDAINFHMKPGVALASQMDSWITAIQQILATPELAKPLYNTEGGYSGQGWTSPFDSPDMEEAYVGQFYVYSIYKGIANTVWYSYSPIHGGIGESAPPNDANTAYSNVYNWMVGSSVPACTLNSDGTNPSSLYICTTTLANGVAAQVMWDISSSMYCSGSICPTINQPVSSSYLSYVDLAGNKTSISGQSVPVGVKPILVQAQ